MRKAWRRLDLEGAGLQRANLRLARLLRKRAAAYGWWLLFPIGAHRFYLSDPKTAWFYPAASGVAALAFFLLDRTLGLVLAGIVTLAALYDLWWIDRRLIDLNKKIRMQVYLQRGAAGAPPGFGGRYPEPDELDTDVREKEQEHPGQQPAKRPSKPGGATRGRSLAEQEALLRELARQKKTKD